MRYRARTSLKSCPRHRGTYPFSAHQLATTAAGIYAWSTTNPLLWVQLSYETQLVWLEEAERVLKHEAAHGLVPIAT